MRRVKLPAQFEGSRLEPASDSPAHGQHTQEVLQTLGKSDQDIAQLVEQGVVKFNE